MCGLVGLLSRDAAASEIDANLQLAVATLRHRGPDGAGRLQARGFALGHTRLSIIDVSDAASQPMQSKDGRYAIVFNGEIYNFRDLYTRYCPQDGSVNGNSDTAVLLHLLSEYGAEAIGWLDGMFAFVHADLVEGRAILARDRFGEKPLYYTRREGRLVFGSELRAMRSLMPGDSAKLCEESAALYLMTGSIPAPRTAYEGVFSITPGHYVTCSSATLDSQRPYWSLQRDEAAVPTSYAEAAETTRALLLGAVRSRLVSDVPVALFLSGGYDSSALMSCCAALGHPQRLAICVDFEEKGYSEFAKAETVARHYGAVVHRHLITKDTFEKSLDGFFASMDQPTGDGYNTYFVCGAAKTFGVKVWLSGVGGDELFGGYSSFRRMTRWSLASRGLQHATPAGLREGLLRIADDRIKVSRVLHMGDDGLARLRAYQACRNPIPWRVVCGLLDSQSDFGRLLDDSYPPLPPNLDDFQAASFYEASVYMRSQLLRDIDNFSMSHSLELRAPFLEPKLFAAVFGMPAELKRNGRTIKPLLGDSVPIPFPASIREQSKQGFGFPVEIWLKSGVSQWFLEATELLSSLKLLNPNAVAKLWGAYQRGSVHWSVLWNIYAFAKWASVNDAHR